MFVFLQILAPKQQIGLEQPFLLAPTNAQKQNIEPMQKGKKMHRSKAYLGDSL
jgi:hypothetical protein